MADTGTGMPPELVARVFEPFFTTKAMGMESGLGLSQVDGFIKQSGGEVRIESEPGRGTRVTLHLPRTTEVPVPSATPPGVPMVSIDGRTILVVEDNDDVFEVAVAMLADVGYGVLTARNAVEATALLEGGGWSMLTAVDNAATGFAVIGKPYRRAELKQKLAEILQGTPQGEGD
jgi:hypothetical protein